MRIGLSMCCAAARSIAVPLTSVSLPWSARFEADDAVLSGSDITSLTDRIGSYALTPSASKPTISTAQFSGRNSVRFTAASNQYLINNTTAALYGMANGTDPTITIAWQSICSTAPNEAEFWKWGDPGGATTNRLSAGTISTTTLRLFDNGVTGSANTSFTVADMTAAAHVYIIVMSGTVQRLYVDGVLNGTTGSMAMSSARTATDFMLGALANNVFKGDFFLRRWACMKSAATVEQRAAIQSLWATT